MKRSLQSIDDKILRSLRAKRSASTISAKHYARYGNALAVGQALSRLAKAGKIRRIRQGLYDLPRPHPVIGQTAPDPMATVRALMEGSSAQWQVSGAYAANLLGLSEQVPGRIVVLTNGSSRQVKLGKLTLVFRRAAPRYLLGAPGVVRVAGCTAAFDLRGRHVAVEGLAGDPTVFGGCGRVAQPRMVGLCRPTRSRTGSEREPAEEAAGRWSPTLPTRRA